MNNKHQIDSYVPALYINNIIISYISMLYLYYVYKINTIKNKNNTVILIKNKFNNKIIIILIKL